MLPPEHVISVVAVAVLAAFALAFGIAAAVLWRTARRISASARTHSEVIANASNSAHSQIVTLRVGLARAGSAAETALGTLPRVDVRIDEAQEELRQRRLTLDATRARLLTKRDLVGRIKMGWRALQQVSELGRVLGW